MTLRVALDEIMKLKVHRSWKNVLTCLLNHRDWRTGYSSPGVELIVEETGLGKRQVQRILGYLEELDGAGKITPMGNTLGGAGRTTIYQLNLRGCVLEIGKTVTSKTVTSTVTFRAKGDFRPDIRPDILSTRKPNKVLFPDSRDSRRLPPQSEKRAAEGRSRFARAIENIDRICAGDD